MGVRRMVVWSEYPAESRFPDLLYKRLNIVTEELDKKQTNNDPHLSTTATVTLYGSDIQPIVYLLSHILIILTSALSKRFAR